MTSDIGMDSEGMYSEITMQDFFFLIGGSLQVVLKKNENSHEVLESSFSLNNLCRKKCFW